LRSHQSLFRRLHEIVVPPCKNTNPVWDGDQISNQHPCIQSYWDHDFY
jgi:hypothetical protein